MISLKAINEENFVDAFNLKLANAYELSSPNAKELRTVFHKICRENSIMETPDACFDFMNDFPEKYRQMSLFT